jgi:ammonia channel protein AmtB
MTSDLVLLALAMVLTVLAIYGPVIGWMIGEWWSDHKRTPALPVEVTRPSRKVSYHV